MCVPRLLSLDLLDEKRRLRDEARNTLEGFVYSAKDKLGDAKFQEMATPEALSQLQVRTETFSLILLVDGWGISLYWENSFSLLKAQLDGAGEWLDGDGDSPRTDTRDYEMRLKSLKLLHEPIQLRVLESIKRPDAIADCYAFINSTHNFIHTQLQGAESDSDDEKKEFDEDVLMVQGIVSDLKTWLEGKVEEQDKLAPYQPPALLSSDIEKRLASIKAIFSEQSKKSELAEKKKLKATTTPATSTTTPASTPTAASSAPTPVIPDESDAPETHERDEL